MFMREFKVIDSAVSVDQLKRRLKSEELEQYGDAFTPEFVYDAIRKLPRFAAMRVSIRCRIGQNVMLISPPRAATSKTPKSSLASSLRNFMTSALRSFVRRRYQLLLPRPIRLCHRLRRRHELKTERMTTGLKWDRGNAQQLLDHPDTQPFPRQSPGFLVANFAPS
jgi:hypothetical protein